MPESLTSGAAPAAGRGAPAQDRPADARRRSRLLPGAGWWRLRVRNLDPATVATLACLVSAAVFVAIRLGPALLGLKTFSPADMLSLRAPWWNGGPVDGIANDSLGDPIDAVLPTYVQMHARLFSGDIPWWSSLSGPGAGLLYLPGTTSLTPSGIFMLLLPTSWATGVAKLVQLAMAIAGMTLWLRRVGAVWAAGLLAGLVYIGTGFFAAWGDWAGQPSVAALIPALFWSIERYLQVRTIRSALVISVVVAFLLFGGFPASTGHALYAGAAYFIVRLIADRANRDPHTGWVTFGLGGAAVALGVGLSAAQFLPQLRSIAASNLDYRTNQFYAVQPLKSLLTVVVPRALTPTGFAGSNPPEAYAYVGIGALFLGGIAMVAPRSTNIARGVLTFLIVGMLLSAALVWKHGWWTDWMAGLPVFSGNNSGRLRDMVGLFGSAIAGIGFNLVLRPDLDHQVRRRLTASGVFGLLGVIAAMWLIWRRYGATVDHRTFLVDAGLGLATTVLMVAVVAVGRRRRWVVTVGVVGVIALTVVLSGNSVAYFWPLSPTSDFYPENPVIQAAQTQSDGQRVATIGAFIGSTASVYNLRTVTGHTFQPESWSQLLTAIDPQAYGTGRSATNPTLSLSLSDGSLNSPLLDRLAANTVIVAQGTSIPGPVRLPDGSPSAARGTPGPAILPVANHSAVSLPISGGAVRAVEVYNTRDILGGASGVQITATISDSGGHALATGSFRRPDLHPTWYQIPVAGEALAGRQGPFTLSIGVNSGGEAPTALALAGTNAVPTARIIGSSADGIVETFAGDEGTVWKRPAALPRIRWANDVEVLSSPVARIAAMAGPKVPAGTVVLSAPGQTPSGKGATLRSINDTGDNVTVDVNAAGAGYLVVADWMQSGWSVSIDGKPGQLVDADQAFSGVFVPGGNHRVEFGYRGLGLTAGFLISGVSALIFVALYLSPRYWRRRPQRVRGARTGLKPAPAMPGGLRPPGSKEPVRP